MLVFFATIHGIPYFYQSLKDWGGAGLDNWFDMRIQWTGVAAWASELCSGVAETRRGTDRRVEPL